MSVCGYKVSALIWFLVPTGCLGLLPGGREKTNFSLKTGKYCLEREKNNKKLTFPPPLKTGVEYEMLPWRGEVRGKSQRITGPKRDRSVKIKKGDKYIRGKDVTKICVIKKDQSVTKMRVRYVFDICNKYM